MMPRSAVSDLGLHCLPITLLQVSRLNGLTTPLMIMEKYKNNRISVLFWLKKIDLFGALFQYSSNNSAFPRHPSDLILLNKFCVL